MKDDDDSKPIFPGWDELDGAYARREDPATSKASAAELQGSDRLSQLQMAVTTALQVRPMTMWETSDYTGIEYQTISPRFAPLADKGIIRSTGATRKNPRGHQAIVWEVTPNGDEAAAVMERRLKMTCRWVGDADGRFRTGCGCVVTLELGPDTPTVKFCLSCGKPMRPVVI
jgi:hypothetical protein